MQAFNSLFVNNIKLFVPHSPLSMNFSPRSFTIFVHGVNTVLMSVET